MPKPLEAVNDFVVKFANVNGSGSASANALFAKSVLRMGVRKLAQHLPGRTFKGWRPGTRCGSAKGAISGGAGGVRP